MQYLNSPVSEERIPPISCFVYKKPLLWRNKVEFNEVKCLIKYLSSKKLLYCSVDDVGI